MINTGINVLSLFDGISCTQIALKNLGIKVDKYYASEIDTPAIKITKKNFPNTIQLGDIKNIKGKDLPKITLITGGSPCQGFSFAGKQLAFDDPRSALFFEFIRILKEVKPKYFLLENVRMEKKHIQVINETISKIYPDSCNSNLFGEIEPILINSALLSAQNRNRLYWTNIPNIKQPKDLGLVLRDVLEPFEGCGEELKKMTTKKGKAFVLTASYQGAVACNSIERRQRTMIPKVAIKSMTEVRTPEANKIRQKHIKETGKDWSPRDMRHLVERKDDKSNTITANTSKQHTIQIEQEEKLTWRKLTPLECERLQTVPDNYTDGVSNTQRYKMLGNGFTVKVIEHILSNMEA